MAESVFKLILLLLLVVLGKKRPVRQNKTCMIFKDQHCNATNMANKLNTPNSVARSNTQVPTNTKDKACKCLFQIHIRVVKRPLAPCLPCVEV